MIKKTYLEINVLEHAQQIIKSIFDSGVKVMLSFSAGKDSIVLADIIYNMIVTKKIDGSQLEVVFVDEELIFEEIIQSAKHWRDKFLNIGVKFSWYCVEVAYFNAFDKLDNSETFIQWDKRDKENWVRTPPPWAIMDNEYLINRRDGYRDWIPRMAKAKGQVMFIGLYAEESITRTISVASKKGMVNGGIAYPLLSWTRQDIWFYIRKYQLEYPSVYEDLYRIGMPKSQLRVAPLTSIDVAKHLHNYSEIKPDLLKRISKRVPNAYLSALYYDTEMFRGSTKNKERKNKEAQLIDYREESIKLINQKNSKEASQLRRMIIMNSTKIDDSHWKQVYNILVAGDPKNRAIRQLLQHINDFSKRSNK